MWVKVGTNIWPLGYPPETVKVQLSLEAGELCVCLHRQERETCIKAYDENKGGWEKKNMGRGTTVWRNLIKWQIKQSKAANSDLRRKYFGRISATKTSTFLIKKERPCVDQARMLSFSSEFSISSSFLGKVDEPGDKGP